MNEIIDAIVSAIETLVKSSRGIKDVYKGDPLLIPKVSLPAITVSPDNTIVEPIDTTHDYMKQSIAISVILDARKYFNISDTEQAGLFELAKIIEERDASSELKTDTIMYAIQNSIYNNAKVLRVDNFTIDYGFTFEKRDFPTIEGVASFTVVRRIHSK